MSPWSDSRLSDEHPETCTMQPLRYKTSVTIVIVAAALAGVWVSGTLLASHDGGWRTDHSGTGFLLRLCESPSLPGAGCANVVGSRWGGFDFYLDSRRVVVPTSWLGLAYFVFVAVWFGIVGGVDARRRWTWLLTWLLVSSGLAGSVFFMALMAFALSDWCPPCVIAHVLNAMIFLATVWLWRRRRPVQAEDGLSETAAGRVLEHLHRRLAWSAAMVGVVMMAGLWLYFDAVSEARRQWRKYGGLKQALAELQSDPRFVLREYFAQPVVDVPAAHGAGRQEPGVGSAAAPVLVVFTDYDHGSCACFEAKHRPMIEAAFEGALRIDVRHYPAVLAERLAIGTKTVDADDEDAPLASYAVEAARLQGGDDAGAVMHRLMFGRRKDRLHRDYAELARMAELDVDRFMEDWRRPAVREAVEEDVRLAAEMGVRITPTVFLNGRRVPYLCLESPTFWQAVASELAEDRSVASARVCPTAH